MNNRQIIACVDQSPYANAVADCAAWVSTQVEAPIEFLHAIDRHPEQGSGEDHSGAIGFDAQEALLNKLLEDDRKKVRAARDQGRLFLNGLKQRLSHLKNTQVDTRLRHGSLVETLAEREDHARVFVMGRKGESSADSNRDIGRTFEQAVRAIKKPVLGVQSEFVEPKRFLFAFDGSAVSK
ncbi:MAG: universal stress protein, partial [Limnobacter sp.]|nr:universal stress protein [Limnobacter sp.]